jgi:hypothetical protein
MVYKEAFVKSYSQVEPFSMKKLSVILALCSVLTLLSQPVYTQEFGQMSCLELEGVGTWSDPVIIGPVSKPLMVTNCPGLSSGRYLNRYYNHRYYKITFETSPGARAMIGAVVRPTGSATSPVHPGLATQQGVTLLRSGTNGFWVGNPDSSATFGRYISLTGIEAGTYLLGVEKLDKPLQSLQTPGFTLVIVP